MSDRLQAALATLLVDAPSRLVLRDRPDEVGRRFRLTSAELDLLVSLDPGRLELTACAGEAKRIKYLKRGMPATVALLEKHQGCCAVLRAIRGYRPSSESVLTSRVLHEGRGFADHLPDGWLRDLALFELAMVEVADAPAPPGGPEMDGRRVRLGSHVRVMEFGHDVVDLYARAGSHSAEERSIVAAPTVAANLTEVEDWDAIVARPTWVVLAKGRPRVRVYRVGERVARMLLGCEESRPVDEMLDGEERMAVAVRAALSEGLLLREGAECASAQS